jgi:hypothetical protein
VLDMAPLIMVTLPMVSSFFSTFGCILRDGWSPFGDHPSLSLACGWPLGKNGSPFGEWRHLQDFRVEDPSGARKGGRTDIGSGLGRPAWAEAHPRPARSLLHARGSSGDYAFCPLHLHDFGDAILASKIEVLSARSSVFYASIPGGVPL